MKLPLTWLSSPLRAALSATLSAALLGVTATAATASESKASFHPTKPVTIVVPYSAGGGTDVMGRLFAKHLGDLWKQSVVVDNRTGANGTIGSGLVARAAPDGMTLLLAVSSIAINQWVMPKMPYDTPTAFTPITPVAYSVVVLVGSPAMPATDMKSFLALAKQVPGARTFASSEPATRVTAEQIFEAGRVRLTHIPYRGAGQWMTDILAGNVDVGVASVTSAQPYMKDGRIRVLGIAGAQRSPLLPDVPTFKEQGIAGQEAHGWYGLFAPGGTPPAIVDAIHADVLKVLALPEVQSQVAALGALPGGEAPAEFSARFQRQITEYGDMTRKLGIRPE